MGGKWDLQRIWYGFGTDLQRTCLGLTTCIITYDFTMPKLQVQLF